MSTKRDNDTSLTLMMRIQQNPTDGQAWEEFVDRYQPMIRDWCLKWGSQASDAEDVAQEVLLKLLTAMKRFHYDPGRSFRAWLKTVTHNAWNDFISSQRLKSADDPDRFDSIVDSRDALADLEKQMEDAFDRELLELAMRRVEKRVKPSSWEAFRLTAIENHSGVEAAQQLHIPVAHVFVAKQRVQKMLEEEVRILRRERG
jgi:RNA polymerase sigma factor (sigma-70 family)